MFATEHWRHDHDVFIPHDAFLCFVILKTSFGNCMGGVDYSKFLFVVVMVYDLMMNHN